jgi:phospholipase/carboxylesterase
VTPRSLVVLHGYEDEPDHYVDGLALDRSRWSTVAPRGPVGRAGGPAWFDSDDAGPIDADLVRSLGQLTELVASLAPPEGRVDPVVGGFSQGGAVALALGLTEDGPAGAIGGLFSVNGWLPHADALHYLPDGLIRRATPVLVVASADDEVVPVQQGRSAARYLERAGVAVTYVEQPAGHAVGPDTFAAVREWLDALNPTDG